MSTQRQARLAFIGCGSFSTASIFPNVHLVPQIDLVAVCDVDESKAVRNARNFGARRVYTDLEQMLDKEELDGVFCIGPAPQQYQLAPHVLRRGIPVYVEKPSAVTSQQAKELAQLAEANSVWGQVGFMKRFADVYVMAQEILHRAEFGPLHFLFCKFAQGPYPQIWGIDSPRRAMLIGQLCHIFDLVRFFAGDPAKVQAFYHEATPTQFAYAVNVVFESGAVGQLDLNSLEAKTGFRDIVERLELVGCETHLVCEDMMRLKWQAREDFSQAVPRAGRYLHAFEPAWNSMARSAINFGYRGEVEHFARRCLGEAQGGPDLWDSYWSLLFGEAVYDSAHAGGKVVTLEG
ncbi:MAG: Gfo/Idh/MocA family oxidoreductase [Planctomycetes bacterium]|nr:Gfo/Idh/MocA family oxidoreductase [Planctomycetota bacterium]